MAALLDQGFATLPATRPVQPQTAPLIAAAPPPAPTAYAVPRAAGFTRMAATSDAAPASSSADSAGTRQKPGFLGNVAKTAMRHLSPVAKAEAAPVAREAPSGGADWAIQLGAFKDEAAAERAAARVAGLAVVKGKPHQVIAPRKNDPDRLYRARLLRFTAKGAQAACTELRRKRIACSVVNPGGLKIASQ